MPDTPGESLAVVVRQVLSDRGAMDEDDLLNMLNADGVDLGHDPGATLADILDEDAEPVMPLIDERWAWIPALLDGRTFTHRLSEPEVEHDIISWGPDLAPVSMLTESDSYQRLVDGSPIIDVSPQLDEDALAARGIPVTVIDSEGALLRGNELDLHANSVARFERVLATVRALDPSVTVLRETREPASDLAAIRQLSEGDPPDEVLDAGIAPALDEVVRKHEAAWLDEPIPALGGRTPRQCADDPTGRPDLIRLPESFPQDDSQPGTMSPIRLRAALGLD